MESENFKIVGVSKEIVTIEILDTSLYVGQFNIGSYLKIPYQHASEEFVLGIIKNYRISNMELNRQEQSVPGTKFVIEVELIGSYKKQDRKYIFERGAHGIPLPPNNGIELLSSSEYDTIYSTKIKKEEHFEFSKLVQNEEVRVPINGNKFFNKHFAIVGSTGSGKSHSVATILQQAVISKNSGYEGLNNSHIIIFDIHGEYKKAFPRGNHLDSKTIKIPYWLFDGEELNDLFIESNEENSHNQVSQFRYAVTENKKEHQAAKTGQTAEAYGEVFYDSPLKFDVDEVICYIKNMNNELINKKNNRSPTTKTSQVIDKRIPDYFHQAYEFEKIDSNFNNGPFTGDFERFILRLETVRNNPRLKFLFDSSENASLEEILQQFLSYKNDKSSNVTVIDLSGIPFEVLSITVSLISRILFEFGYYYKKILKQDVDCECPLLLVYEEAHKYVPKSDLVKYRASRNAIERIAKEGRKYGVTLGIVSQRPSEISETIFSQCNNFIALRLTNPDDQNYVKRLLPDSLGGLTDYLPSLQAGEALIIGEAIALPSLVKIDMPADEPQSTDIKYFELWKEAWKNVDFGKITKDWKND